MQTTNEASGTDDGRGPGAGDGAGAVAGDADAPVMVSCVFCDLPITGEVRRGMHPACCTEVASAIVRGLTVRFQRMAADHAKAQAA